MALEQIFQAMVDKWPSAVVSRGEVINFSGGLLDGRRLANLDSQGLGPEVRVRISGRKIGYPVGVLAGWMQSRAEVIERGPAGGRVGSKK